MKDEEKTITTSIRKHIEWVENTDEGKAYKESWIDTIAKERDINEKHIYNANNEIIFQIG
jgi:hypothetical protein